MSDREVFVSSLAKVAARLRWSRLLRECGRVACVLVGLALLAQVLAILGAPAEVRSALSVLLILTATAAAVLFAWRSTRPTTLSHAARAADTRADLKDEFRSALWFAQHPSRDALVGHLLARAAQHAQTMDARSLFPLGIPRSALAALALAAFAAALAWFSPEQRLHAARELRADASVAGPTAASAAAREQRTADMPTPVSPEVAARSKPLVAEPPRAHPEEPGAASTGEPPHERATGTSGAALAAGLARAAGARQAGETEQARSARESGEDLQAGLVQGIADPLRGISQSDSQTVQEPDSSALPEAAARVTERIEQQIREERRKLEGTPAQGEVRLNRRLRAIRRDSAAPKQLAHGEGEAAEAGAQTSVDGTAVGPPGGKGRAGGTSGEHPQSSPNDSVDTLPVLGEKTVPLVVQLDKAHVEPDDDPQREAAKEAFYAATQRRASQARYETIAPQWRTREEATQLPLGTPASYRESVKRYLLSEHARQE